MIILLQFLYLHDFVFSWDLLSVVILAVLASLIDLRAWQVRKKSAQEMVAFQQRWTQAVREDPTWVDPYKEYAAAEMAHTTYRAKSGVKP